MATQNLLKFPHRPSSDSRWTKFLNSFLTQRGRAISQKIVGALTICVSSAYVLRDTYFIENYIDLIRAYKNGMPIQVPEEMEEKIDAVIDKAKFIGREAAHLKSFMVSGFDVYPCGSVNSNCYGWIGIPLNYLYKSTTDIDRINLKLRDENIDWNSKYGEMLEDSLVLTDDEKEFGLLKTAFELRNYNFSHKAILSGGSIFTLYVLAQNINEKFNLYEKPRSMRWLMYSLVGTFVYGVYAIITDTIRIQQDVNVDKALAALGTDICETGIRFYDKLLNKNIAVRELSGKDIYSVKGNEYPGFLRWTKLALTSRKQYFTEMLAEKRKAQDELADKINNKENEK